MKQFITIYKILTLLAPTIRILGTLLFILPFAASTSAEIYRWTDAQGKTHFSEHPPENRVKSEEVSSKLPPLNRDSSAEETKKLQLLFKGATPEEEAHQQQEKAHQQQRDQQKNLACNKAKKKLIRIRGRVYFTDADGKEVVISEKERQQRVTRLEKEIQHRCP
jgi:hypothetical protein